MRKNTGKRYTWRISGWLVFFCLLGCTQVIACSPGTFFSQSATSPASSPAASPNAQESQIALAVFHAINQDRQTRGLSPLQWSNALARSASQHNSAMMAANQLAHQVSGEAGLGDRERQQGVMWQIAAENIGVTSDMTEHGALELHQAMMAERPPDDGHRQNILSTQTQQLGVAILLDSLHNKLWLTEDFARAGNVAVHPSIQLEALPLTAPVRAEVVTSLPFATWLYFLDTHTPMFQP